MRHAWAGFFESAHAIIFILAASEYDVATVEDGSVNRLADALHLFEQVCANKILKNVDIVLFFNKIDQLKRKLKVRRIMKSLAGL